MMNRDRGDNPKLTLLPFLITAMARALPEWPMLNATYDDDANVITRHGSLHLGMATQTPNGLMVPVIRDAQSKGVWDLAREITRLAEAARPCEHPGMMHPRPGQRGAPLAPGFLMARKRHRCGPSSGSSACMMARWVASGAPDASMHAKRPGSSCAKRRKATATCE